MSYYHICPDCGAALDPDERCDCQDRKPAAYCFMCAMPLYPEDGSHVPLMRSMGMSSVRTVWTSMSGITAGRH